MDRIQLRKFISNQQNLIEIEKEAQIRIERDQIDKLISGRSDLNNSRFAIPNLKFQSFRKSFNGQLIISFVNENSLLQAKLVRGNFVSVRTQFDLREVLFTAVLWKIEKSVVFLFYSDPLNHPNLNRNIKYAVIKAENYATFDIMKKALIKFEESDSTLKDVFVGFEIFGLPRRGKNRKIRYFNAKLNQRQKEVIRLCLNLPKLAIIEGPPGTGKSTTLIEIIQQLLLAENPRILVCAPSNVATDHLLDIFCKLDLPHVSFLRIGNDARISEKNLVYSLSREIENSDDYEELSQLRKAIHKLRTDDEKIFEIKKYMYLENYIKHKIISKKNVIFSTLAGVNKLCFKSPFKRCSFDVVIIDEASQAMEAISLVPLELVDKYILAGDSNQLPPVIISPIAARGGLDVSLMSRLSDLYPQFTKMLTVQYRMHQKIMEYPSDRFYFGELVASSLVANHLLSDLKEVKSREITRAALLTVDTAMCNFREETKNLSKCNKGEVAVVWWLVERLIYFGVSQHDIGVITFYNAQVELIKKGIRNDVEVSSVDSFQGREKEVIIISFVRSSRFDNVGFLSDYRRVNVALTRARRLLALVLDSSTLSRDPSSFLRTMVDHYKENADILLSPSDLSFMPSHESKFYAKMHKIVSHVDEHEMRYTIKCHLTRKQKKIIYQIIRSFPSLKAECTYGKKECLTIINDGSHMNGGSRNGHNVITFNGNDPISEVIGLDYEADLIHLLTNFKLSANFR